MEASRLPVGLATESRKNTSEKRTGLRCSRNLLSFNYYCIVLSLHGETVSSYRRHSVGSIHDPTLSITVKEYQELTPLSRICTYMAAYTG